jgi:hypothetical protein
MNNKKNERQGDKTHTVFVRVLVEGERVNKGDAGEGIWFVGFIHVYEIE